MTAASPPLVQGWCPSLLRPMASGDGLVARIKPTAATLTAVQARALAQAAARHGNGELEVTRRGNLQARGFTEAGHAAFAGAALAQGLAAPDPTAEALRTVLASPLAPADDPSCRLDAHALARALEPAKATDPALAALPQKMGVAVDGGGALPISAAGLVHTADLTIAPADDGRTAIRLARQADGRVPAVVVPPADAVAATVALLRAFLSLAGSAHRRMATLVHQIGAAPVFTAAGLGTGMDIPVDTAKPRTAPGIVPLGAGRTAVMVTPAFGRLTAADLLALADLSGAAGDGTLRLTPWRALVLPGVPATNALHVLAEAAALGFVTEPDDPRLRIAACAGAPRCPHGRADVLADADRFAAALPAGLVLHVSGCAKGCAHSRPAAVTVTADRDGYRLIRNGRAGDAPVATGLSADAVIRCLSDMQP